MTCPYCDGHGYITVGRTAYGHDCGGDERLCQRRCPIPVQVEEQEGCEFCQTTGEVDAPKP